MGVLDVPRRIVHSYMRLVGLSLLIVYNLFLRFWNNIKPSVQPVVNIYDTIDPDTVSVVTILQQCVKVLLMTGLLYYRAVMSVWETVTAPFRKQVEAATVFMEELKGEYNHNTSTKLQ